MKAPVYHNNDFEFYSVGSKAVWFLRQVSVVARCVL